MKPPVCNVCREFIVPTDDNKASWVTFADYDSDAPVVIGHPDGYEFFCGEHIDEARKLTGLSAPDAIERLNELYKHENFEQSYDKPVEKKWWHRFL